ncbi:F420-dependent methylene-tetrahydromethanopterin reductase, partial [Streptomyces anulatus]
REGGGGPMFVCSALRVAAAFDHFVQTEGADGFVLVPHLTPGGLDDVVDRVVPLLQEKGSFRADYTGTTLRNHLRPHSGTTRRAVNEQKASPA